MISTLATNITNTLCAASLIEGGDKELYIYGFFILISRLFFLLVSILCGLLFGVPWESVLFYVMFTLLRSYAGGIHAKTENMCTILTTLSLLASICGIRVLSFVQNEMIALVMLGIGSVCIIAFSPLDTAEKPLESEERHHYKRISIIIVAAYDCFPVGYQSSYYCICRGNRGNHRSNGKHHRNNRCHRSHHRNRRQHGAFCPCRRNGPNRADRSYPRDGSDRSHPAYKRNRANPAHYPDRASRDANSHLFGNRYGEYL